MSNINVNERFATENRLVENNNLKGLKMVQRDLHCHRKGSLYNSYQIAKRFGISYKDCYTKPTVHLKLEPETKYFLEATDTGTTAISLGDLKNFLKYEAIPYYKSLIATEDTKHQLYQIFRKNYQSLMSSPRVKSLIRKAPQRKDLSLGLSLDFDRSVKDSMKFVKHGIMTELNDNLATTAKTRQPEFFKQEAEERYGARMTNTNYTRVFKGFFKLYCHQLSVAEEFSAPGNPYGWNDNTVMTLEPRSMPNDYPDSAQGQADFDIPKWDGTTKRQTKIIKKGMDFESQNNVDFRPATDNSLRKAVDDYLSNLARAKNSAENDPAL